MNMPHQHNNCVKCFFSPPTSSSPKTSIQGDEYLLFKCYESKPHTHIFSSSLLKHVAKIYQRHIYRTFNCFKSETKVLSKN